MWPDQVLNPVPLTYESGVLPTVPAVLVSKMGLTSHQQIGHNYGDGTFVYSRIRKTGGKGITDIIPGLVAIPLSDAKTVN